MSIWNDTLVEHRGKLRDHLIDAAVAAVREIGPTGVTMSALAQRAGVSRQTLYNHFPDIHAILLAYIERETAIDQAALLAVISDTEGPYAKLEVFLRWFAVVQVSRPPTTDIQAMVAANRTVSADDADLAEGVLADIIREGAQAGVFRSEPPSRELAAALAHTLDSLRPLATAGANSDAILSRGADYASRLLS